MTKLFKALKTVMKGEKGSTFMVGVLICSCGVVFAAQSGPAGKSNSDAFCKVAKGLGYRTEAGIAAPVWDRLLSLKKSPKLLRLARTNSEEAIKDHKAFLKARIESPEGTTKIGGCAAPRVIALAIQDGHRPEYMSERWFSPIDRKLTKQTSVHRRYRGVAKFGRPHLEFPPEVTAKAETRTFSHGKNVTSCATCKKQVPALLCADLPECAPKGKK